MKLTASAVAVLVAALLACNEQAVQQAPVAALLQSPAGPKQAPSRRPPQVWVNTRSGIYHCPGSQFYGATKSGTPMLEDEARTRGYRPAGGAACPAALATTDTLPVARGLRAQPRLLTKVWVNSNSGVYHCPGSRSYGMTASGTFMTEGEARSAGYRAAYGKACK